MYCISEKTERLSRKLQIDRGEMQVVRGCDDKREPASAHDGFSAPSGGSAASIGLQIKSDATAEELSVYGISWSRFSSPTLTSVEFAAIEALRSADTGFAGIAMGRTAPLGGENYTPVLTLANFSDSVSEVLITSAMSASAASPKTSSRRVTIPALSTETMTLESDGADSRLQNSILVQPTTAPGSVVAKLVSTARPEFPVLEYQPKDVKQLENSGLHPWTIEGGKKSTMLLFNSTAQEQYFNIKIYAGDKPWQKALLLKPLETRAVEVGQLIASQEPDDLGVKLPVTATHGELHWSTAGRWKGLGRLVVSSKTHRLARNFSCGQCVVPCDVAFSPSQLALQIDGQDAFYGNVALCMSDACQCKDGWLMGYGGSGYNYAWSSADTGISSINGATNLDSANFVGVGIGGTDGNVQVSDAQCDVGAFAPVDVVSAALSMKFSGSKTTGDNLTFPSYVGSQTLGLRNASSYWLYSVEGTASVSDDAGNWTVHQSYTGRKKGYYRDGSGTLHAFDVSLSVPDDGPDASFVQQTAGQKTIFWIDSPGLNKNYSGYPIDSVTQVQNFTLKVCTKANSNACSQLTWYFKLVVNSGGVLDTTNSTASTGSAPTNF